MGKFGMSAAATGIEEYMTAILFTFAGIALYNTIELLVLILVTFKRFRGLYFWSLATAAVGILPYTLGLLFKFYNVITNHWVSVTIIVIGWHAMVTGQSIVMYSRLHLVTSNRKLTKAVLAMIIANWFVSNVPITVVVYGIQSSRSASYVRIYGIWERLQVCLYAAQESIIAILYIVQVAKLLRIDTTGNNNGRRGSGFVGKPRRIMKHLIYVNILIIALDITLLAVEFAGYYQLQVLYKGALYSCKLKMEFWILNQLTVISSHKLRQAQDTFSNDEVYGTSFNTTVASAHAHGEKKHSSGGVTLAGNAPVRSRAGGQSETESANVHRKHERSDSNSSSDDVWLGKQPQYNELENP